jgi:UDP-2,4-diacetamido-2,4,6-trideoxy-beta-L-altropyranose hydrolase
MRCLVLADALAARGAKVRFVCRAHPGHYGELIATGGHALALLSPDEGQRIPDAPRHARWLGADQPTDAAATLAVIAQHGRPDLLLVDHYGLDAGFERSVRPAVGRIAVVDDLADRPHECDILVDQTVGRTPDDYAGLTPASVLLLLGADYALVPPAFAAARRPRDGKVGRVLVFLGGIDATNAGLDALRGLDAAGAGEMKIAVDILVGGSNPHRAAIEAFAAARAWIRVLPPQPSLAPLVGAYDLACGAGGVSATERAVAGLPSIALAVADNQVAGAESLASAGASLYLGQHDAFSATAIADAVRVLLRSPQLMRHLSDRGMELYDGRGLARVVSRLAPLAIALRRVEGVDAERIWRWRNHMSTRRYSGDPSEIPLDRHLAWFEKNRARADCDLLIGSDVIGDVGVLRFDVNEATAVASVYLDPARRGQGQGAPLIEAGARWLARHRPNVVRVEARILPANIASRRAFAEAGFVEGESLFVLDVGRAAAAAVSAVELGSF